MYKVDLHTHSVLSHDGGLTDKDYLKIIKIGILDYVAITDHNQISFAKELAKKLGDFIIVGEEITTTEGDIIGLFLKELVPGNLSLEKAVQRIKDQGGLVYIPHPLEKLRQGVSEASLAKTEFDLIEEFNGRAFFRNRDAQVKSLIEEDNLVAAASSDAHSLSGVGFTYTEVAEKINRTNLIKLIKQGKLVKNRPPIHTFFTPKLNKLRKALS